MRLAHLFSTLVLSAGILPPASAADAPQSPQGDPGIARQLKQLDYKYEVDKDGDFRMVFEMDEGRSQQVFVMSATEDYGPFEIREVWAPAYRAKAADLPADVANRLLQDSQHNKLGGWVRQAGMAVFVVKLDADAPAAKLEAAIDYTLRAADQMEEELTQDADEF